MRKDLLERLSQDDPNHGVLKDFYLETWAASHALVADGFGGRLSLADFVEGCLRTYSKGAEAHIRFKDNLSIRARCRELDCLTKKVIAKLRHALLQATDHLGEAPVQEALQIFSQRVAEINARSKQRILEAERLESQAPMKSELPSIGYPDFAQPPYRSTRVIQMTPTMDRVAYIRVPKFHFEYPADFPGIARRRILAERLHAEKVFEENKSGIQDFPTAEAAVLQFVLDLFMAFVAEGYKLGMQKRITAADVEAECAKFLLRCVVEAGLLDGMLIPVLSEISDSVRNRVEASAEWKVYRRMLEEVADRQAGAKHPHPISAPTLPRQGDSGARRTLPQMLLKVVAAKNITIEGWCQEHKFSRSAVYTWKAGRIAGQPLKGKVSGEKIAAIERAIEMDSAALGLAS